MNHKKIVTDLFASAGITVDGTEPWDIQVKDDRVYKRILTEADIGIGESYMDSWWECDRIDTFIEKLLRADLEKIIKNNKRILRDLILTNLFNLQSKKRSKTVGEVHYDVGNDLYEKMLGKTMSYTCAYWDGLKDDPKNLDKAQIQKLDLICRKMELKKGMRILDLGCGWANFSEYAARKYGVSVVGITISKEQVKLGRERCKGLPVDIRLQDYRDLKDEEKFDRVISIGIAEHIGRQNLKGFMKVAYENLKDDGLFMIHTIGWKETRTLSGGANGGWLGKYIFPGGDVPSVEQLTVAANGIFQLEDWHNFGTDYAKTLRAWDHNFVKSWDSIKSDYDERFYRMWRFYLMLCAGLFDSHSGRLWHVVLSKNRVGDYTCVR
jgi:cyclopropane-fatty-acyl-phospholipid synthase